MHYRPNAEVKTTKTATKQKQWVEHRLIKVFVLVKVYIYIRKPKKKILKARSLSRRGKWR